MGIGDYNYRTVLKSIFKEKTPRGGTIKKTIFGFSDSFRTSLLGKSLSDQLKPILSHHP